VWHESFICAICATQLVHVCDVIQTCVWCVSFMCVTWLIYMRDMTLSHMWHDSSKCVTWLIHMCDVSHSYICVRRVIFICLNYSYARHDSFMCAPYLIYKHVTYTIVSTEIATPPKSSKSRISDFSVSRGTNSNWDVGLIWICTY